jgi:hypothetical protein
MDLVKAVLCGVSDTRLLADHKPSAAPLHNLIKVYREKSAHNDNAPNLTDLSTGLDLKEGIEKLSEEDQIVLLHQYLVDSKRILPEETPAQIEDRQLKRFVIKAAVWIIGFIAVMLFGAVTAIAYRSGVLPSNEVIGTFLEFAGEIVHVIFEGPRLPGG